MKKIYLFLLLFVFANQSCNAQSTTSNEVPKSMPEFTFYTLNGNQPVSRTSLAIQGNVVFVFFDTGCSVCREDIQLMGENYDKIKDANIYLISQQDAPYVTDFMNTYGKGLLSRKNVTVLLDPKYEFLGIFNPVQYPSVYVYGQERELKTSFDGKKELDYIIEAINK